MASLEQLKAATTTPAMAPQVQPQNMNFTHSSDVLNFIMQGIKETPTNGNRNNFCHVYASDANRFGVNETDCLNYLLQYQERDFTGDEIKQAVRSAYQRTNEFGMKTFNASPPKYNSTMTNPTTPAKAPQVPQENIFLIRTANECIETAKSSPIPKQLFYEFWHEGEIAILFAGTGIGKTILAVQIADELSRKQKVLYFDFELSDKQFERRYSDNFQDHYVFNNNFYRIEINPDAENFSETALYYSIEQTIVTTGAKIVFIDNITYLKNNLETSKDALPLMKVLKQIKKKYDVSLMCIAHTPKRDQTRPVNVNDLAGSMQLANFADSIFTINASSQDKNLRYIKQVKARATEIVFDSENVMICEIRNDHNFIRCHVTDYGKESDHLREEANKQDQKQEVLQMYDDGKTQKEISQLLDLSQPTVSRILKNRDNE